MTLNVYELSAGVFVRGLTSLRALLTKADAHAAASGSGEAELLIAQLAIERHAAPSPADLHRYPLAAHVHWAAEGARLAVGHLLGAPLAPAPSAEKSFAELYQLVDATIAQLKGIAPSDLEAGLDRTIVIKHPRGSMTFTGSQFLLEFAIPHFFYHLTTAYGILRNQGVPLTMGDFLGRS